MSQSRSEAAIALGRRLVAQLDDDGDIAAAWLSHLLAQRLSAVDAATTLEAKTAAEAACTELIFELWRHQAEFPTRLRPFRDLDVVLQTLASLDIDGDPFRYHPTLFRSAGQETVPEAPRQWLELAMGVDATARQIIRLALGNAVEEMGEDMQDWVTLARAAIADEPAESVVISFVLEDGEDDDFDPNREQRQRRLDRLNAFIDLAKGLAAGLAASLGSRDAATAQKADETADTPGDEGAS